MQDKKCYRRISGREKLFLGLELADLLLLQFSLMALLFFTGSLVLTLLILISLFVLIREFKRNKPHLYTERLLKFLRRARFFELSPETLELKG